MKQFKIFGTFRSGTNLLRYLVTQHMTATCTYAGGGQKHLPAPSTYDDVRYVPLPLDVLVTVKDPFATMWSLFEYARAVRFQHFECGLTWETFLTDPFVIHFRTEPPIPAYWFRTPIDYWNAFYFNMLSLDAARSCIIRYEDMLANPIDELGRIAAAFPEAKVTSSPTLPSREMKRMGLEVPEDPMTEKTFTRHDWYMQRDYLKQFSNEQRSQVSAIVDPRVVARLGYQL